MRWVKADSQVEFIVTMKDTNAWLGLTLGGTEGAMKEGDDMVVFFANKANSSFGDYTSKGFKAPAEDTIKKDVKDHPDHSVDWDESAGTVTIFARRALDTGDAGDYVIQLDKQFNVGVAYNGSTSTLSGKHEVASTVAVTLKSDGTPLFGTMPSDGSSEGNGGGNNDDKKKDDPEKDTAMALSSSIVALGAAMIAASLY